MSPSTEEDVEAIERHLEDVKQSIYDYMDILKMGIQKGMVRTQNECVAGINAMKPRFPNIVEQGSKGLCVRF